MLRRRLFKPVSDHRFRERGKDIFRIETLSDAVFAFSISLLVASLEVPQTFRELRSIATGALPFFATVAMIFLFWYQQYVFFRRYGLNDFITILLNLIYLAVILFYVYPMKFLFSLLISSWSGINLFSEANEKGLVVLAGGEFPDLVILFSVGYLSIWLIIYLMHRRVLHSAQAASFNRFELAFTRMEARGGLMNAGIGLAALLLAWRGHEIMAGICYLFIPLMMAVNYYLFRQGTEKA